MGTEELHGVSNDTRIVALRLKLERERQGWSQRELADRLGTTQVNVSRWETGQTIPGPYFRQQLVDAFGKSIEDLGLVSIGAVAERREREKSKAPVTASESIPETSQHSLWQVPYRQNPFFTGREDILAQVYTVLNTNQTAALTQTQAITGLGGVGKTQVAIEYAYRYHNDYIAVLWVDASSFDRFKNEFAGLSNLFNLPEQNEANQDIVISAVKRWLATHKGWLLILDNIEDLDIIDKFLPTVSGSKVLLTTRQQALGTLAQGISVDKMEKDEGVLFLLRRSKILAQDRTISQARQDALKHAQHIVEELDGLPLALDQAGAYIEETKCGLSAYLTLYQKHHIRLLNRRGKLAAGHPEPVTATWSLSFQRVAAANPAARELLYLLAFLSPESVSEEMLVKGAVELGPTLGPVIADPLSFNDIIELLLHFSLIRRHSADEGFLSIHRLVQAVLRDSMTQELTRMWAERAIRAVNRAFPEVEQSTWEQCRHYLPHALLCSFYIREYRLAFPEAASLLNKAAAYLIDHAQYKEAEPLLLQALEILKQVQGDTQLDRAYTLNYLGSLYLIQGKYMEAGPRLQESLQIRQQLLGQGYTATTESLTSMAQLYHAQGKYKEAEKLFLEVFEIRQHILEPDNPDIARSQSNLAKLYIDLGRYSEAEDLFLRARSILERAFGQKHRDVANLLNNLALVYRKKAEYEKAEQLYVDALQLQKQVWGQEHEHPDIAETLNNIARLFRAQGRYEEAEPLYKQGLNIRENVFGADHPNVAHSLYGLAKLYHSRGDFQLAEEIGQHALSIQEQRLGKNHPYLADTLVALAKIAQGQQNLDKAEQLNSDALTIQRATTGEIHPRVALINNNLAEIYHQRGDYRQAQPWIRSAISIHEQSLGIDHPYMAYSLTNQAENAFGQGDYLQAEVSFLKALAIRERRLGPYHPRTVSSLRDLVKYYTTLGNQQQGHIYEMKIIAAQTATPASSSEQSMQEKADSLKEDRLPLKQDIFQLSESEGL